MTLPVSGAISFNAINVELGTPGTTTASLGQASYRSLAGVPSGAISLNNFYGKANTWYGTITTNQSNLNLATWAAGQGYPGSGQAVVTINPGVKLLASSPTVAGLTIPSAFPGGVQIINNGAIYGKGGYAGFDSLYNPGVANGIPGGPAISLAMNVVITNNGAIVGGGGGGGGGGAAPIGFTAVGGNGAGSAGGFTTIPGTGGAGRTIPYTPSPSSVSYPAQPGTSSGGAALNATYRPPGAVAYPNSFLFTTGGGGGGWGAAGGTGGQTAVPAPTATPVTLISGAGGSANFVGGNGNQNATYSSSGGTGGAAITPNGFVATFPVVGTIYGST